MEVGEVAVGEGELGWEDGAAYAGPRLDARLSVVEGLALGIGVLVTVAVGLVMALLWLMDELDELDELVMALLRLREELDESLPNPVSATPVLFADEIFTDKETKVRVLVSSNLSSKRLNTVKVWVALEVRFWTEKRMTGDVVAFMEELCPSTSCNTPDASESQSTHTPYIAPAAC